MRYLYVGFLTVLMLGTISTGIARGQMFGSRDLGSSFTPRARPGSDVGAVSGGERYLRGNRGRGSFVGRDRSSGTGFVGNTQGTTAGNVASAVQNLRVQATPLVSVNQPRTPRGKGDLYDPRLEIGFALTPPEPAEVQQTLTRRLREESATGRFEQIEVSLEGRTARMRGTVASASDRAVAEALVLFEPGVDAVQNELQVRPAPPEPNP